MSVTSALRACLQPVSVCVLLALSTVAAGAALAPDGSYLQDSVRYTTSNEGVCNALGTEVVVDGVTYRDVSDEIDTCARAFYDLKLTGHPDWLENQPDPVLQQQSGPTEATPGTNVWYSRQGQSYQWHAEVWYSYGGVYLGSIGGSAREATCPATRPVLNGSTCSCPGTVSNGRCFPPDDDKPSNGNPDCGQKCSEARNSGNNSGGGDPIHLGTGNMFLQEADAAIQGGIGLTFSRYYNSAEARSGSLAPWRADYLGSFNALKFTYVNIPDSGGLQTITAKLFRDDGREMTFTATYRPSDSTFMTPWTSVTERKIWLETVDPPNGTWTGVNVHDGSGSYRFYNRSGRLTTISDADGVRATLTLGSSGPTRVQDRFGNRLDFTYASSRVSALAVNGTPWATYTYSSGSVIRINKVTYADGKFREYKYQDFANPNVITSVVDERGITVNRWFYDQEGRGIGSELAAGQQPVDIVYNGDGTVTEVFANGLSYVYSFQTVAGRKLTSRKDRYINGVLTTYYETVYDAIGNKLSERDWEGNITQRTFNSRNLEIARTEAYGTPQARTVTTDWHATLNRPVTVTTPDTITTYTYVGGKLATRTETDRTPWAGAPRTWTYSYFSNGLLQTVDGPRTDVSDVTTYAYTPTLGRIASVTNALGQQTSFSNHTVTGQPGRMTDANGVITDFTYDARGRLLTSTLVDPVAGNLVTTYSYDFAGNITGVESPDGSTLAYEYNDNGDVVAVEDATGARIEYERDLEDNITRMQVRNAGGTLVRRVDQVWDGLKRLTAVVGVANTHASYGYDENGNRTSAADALNHSTLSAFDALDRLVSSTDALNAITGFGYDAEGNLATVTDPRNLATSYEYDGLGCLRRLTSPDTEVTLFSCDKAGNVASKTDARSVTVTYGHDAINRRTSAVYSGAPAETALYGYDATANGNLGIGRLTAAQNDGADVALKYDARGQVIVDARVIGGVNYSTGYAYDAAGRLATLTYPGGRTVTYARNAAGDITGVSTTAPGGSPETVATAITWEPFGPLATLTHGNGVTELRSYDADGYLTNIAVGSLFSRSYARDAAGRITGITDSDPLRSETYGYDNADRLTAADGPYGSRDYGYDAVGNRTSQDEDGNASSYSYGSTSNRLYQITGSDAAALDYDAAGNTTEKGDVTFAYNAANRLASVTVPGLSGPETTTFAYTALGERVLKDGPLGATHFHYDRAGHLIAETSATGAVLREYLWLGDTPIALVAIRNAGTVPELFAVHTDHLDTALALTDSTQAVVWRYQREPFGQLVAGSNTVRWPLRFPGQYEDQETGLFYNYFRDYDPSVGRYVESDPIGLGGGVNTYGYVEGQPIGQIDPSGLLGSVIGRGVVVGGQVAVGICARYPKACINAARAAGAAIGAACAGTEKEEGPCEMENIGSRPSYDGKTYTCVYKNKGHIFTFPQAVGHACPPVDKKRCMVDTSYIVPPARY